MIRLALIEVMHVGNYAFAVPVVAFVSAWFLRAHPPYVWGSLCAIGAALPLLYAWLWAYEAWLIHRDDSQWRAVLKIVRDLDAEGFGKESVAMLLAYREAVRKRIGRLKG
ncbi:MAG: hypothetical protein LBG29_00155 [Synergistaceae bacterium]|jgi:hypothetical protein|nr:hypothetical protein [Synergistaceae bacterium]